MFKIFTIISIFLIFQSLTMAGVGDKSLGWCGLGWKINSDHSWIGITTRGTTNSTSGGTFGTTSGTSGCEQHSLVFNNRLQQHLAESSYDQLIVEMSLGRGENLTAFSRAFGCRDELSTTFAKRTKEHFPTIMDRSSNPLELVNAIYTIVIEDDRLRNGCGII